VSRRPNMPRGPLRNTATNRKALRAILLAVIECAKPLREDPIRNPIGYEAQKEAFLDFVGAIEPAVARALTAAGIRFCPGASK
jgi:hypothetical protein